MITSDIVVERASVNHLNVINDIIVQAKSYWSYPESYLKAALKILEIDERYLSENLCFEVIREGKVVGFASVTEKDGDKYLDHLWIHPRVHKLGLGRMACERIFGIGRTQGWREVFVLPDSPSIGFYKRLGFTETAIQVPSRIKDGPDFPLLRLNLSQDVNNEMPRVSSKLYAPSFYQEVRLSVIHDFIREFPFATLLTVHGEQISHLPMALEQSNTHGYYLLGHMAKANPHWRELKKRGRCKAIFHGPHGYISPAWYAPKNDNVPTWNYMVVHAAGHFEAVTSSEAVEAMHRLVEQFEAEYGTRWRLPKDEENIAALMHEIVVFRIGNLNFDAKFKLSQKQNQADRNNVMTQLKSSGEQILEHLADKMKLF